MSPQKRPDYVSWQLKNHLAALKPLKIGQGQLKPLLQQADPQNWRKSVTRRSDGASVGTVLRELDAALRSGHALIELAPFAKAATGC